MLLYSALAAALATGAAGRAWKLPGGWGWRVWCLAFTLVAVWIWGEIGKAIEANMAETIQSERPQL